MQREKDGFKKSSRPNTAGGSRPQTGMGTGFTDTGNTDGSPIANWQVSYPQGYFAESSRPGTQNASRPQTAGPLGRSTPLFTGTDFNPDSSNYDVKAHARPATGKLPEYVTMDKQVARFYAHFFQERNWDRDGPLGEPDLEKEMCR
jgi:hypothetical protein